MTDYQHDYELAMLSSAAYASPEEIGVCAGDPKDRIPPGWRVLDDTYVNNNKGQGGTDSGFAAISFVNDTTGEVVIAFRGSEGQPLNFDNNTDWIGPDLAMASASPAWNPQFSEALAYTQMILDKYGENHSISVTGHSLGGGLAQVAGQMYGLPGRTYDAPGVDNIVMAPEFGQWAANHLPDSQAKGIDQDFVNYSVNLSPLGLAGGYMGDVVKVSGVAGRDNLWEELRGWAATTITGNLETGLLPWALDIPARHDRERIIDVFDKAREYGVLEQRGEAPGQPPPQVLATTAPASGPMSPPSNGFLGVNSAAAIEHFTANAGPLARQADEPRIDRATHRQLLEAIQSTGRWGSQESENIAAALLLEVKRDPSMRRVDDVWVKDGDRAASPIVAALYMPSGRQDLMFSAQVDAATAAKTPAQDSLALSSQVAQTHADEQMPQRARTI